MSARRLPAAGGVGKTPARRWARRPRLALTVLCAYVLTVVALFDLLTAIGVLQ